MTERKKLGRPPAGQPLVHNLKVRVSEEDMKKIDYCKERLNTTSYATVLRKGLDMVYDDLKQK